MSTSVLLITLFLMLNIIQGCAPDPESPRGFSLPKGDEVEGEKVLMKYQCLACHNLEGIDYDSVNKEFEPPVLLGGPSTRVKTYADLVTSIINPSHKLARNYRLSVTQQNGISKMIVFNDVMTITELVNLVAFLQPKYNVPHYKYTHYGHYELD